MRTLVRYASSIGTAAALLAGCGGSQPPIAAPECTRCSHHDQGGRVEAQHATQIFAQIECA
jgi:hypothetical protein